MPSTALNILAPLLPSWATMIRSPDWEYVAEFGRLKLSPPLLWLILNANSPVAASNNCTRLFILSATAILEPSGEYATDAGTEKCPSLDPYPNPTSNIRDPLLALNTETRCSKSLASAILAPSGEYATDAARLTIPDFTLNAKLKVPLGLKTWMRSLPASATANMPRSVTPSGRVAGTPRPPPDAPPTPPDAPPTPPDAPPTPAGPTANEGGIAGRIISDAGNCM